MSAHAVLDDFTNGQIDASGSWLLRKNADPATGNVAHRAKRTPCTDPPSAFVPRSVDEARLDTTTPLTPNHVQTQVLRM